MPKRGIWVRTSREIPGRCALRERGSASRGRSVFHASHSGPRPSTAFVLHPRLYGHVLFGGGFQFVLRLGEPAGIVERLVPDNRYDRTYTGQASDRGWGIELKIYHPLTTPVPRRKVSPPGCHATGPRLLRDAFPPTPSGPENRKGRRRAWPGDSRY
jgi:hypothetical protein